ncbi:TRAP transporter TatT component family protein [Roseateles sp.]|uniref:TRAP transporter TatT component family protein n=1 Tax=Roseateles sp. TaxID=1971397 RepID=UPI003BA7E94A
MAIPRSTPLFQAWMRPAFLLLAALLLSACSPRMLLLKGVADGLSNQEQGSAEDDLQLAREASAYHLKLSEAVLKQTPEHLGLAESVAAGFTQYAYAFVAQSADELANRDARAAQRQRERAARLYWRARQHAMQALELRHPGFASALAAAAPAGPVTTPLTAQGVLNLAPDELGLAYWAAASWGAHIALSKDQPDKVADLPQVVALAQLAWQRQPDFAEGSLSSLRGTLEAARPGGSRAEAEALFERAIQVGGKRNAGIWVARAEALALPAGDRVRFEAWLHEALAVSRSRPDLANQVMQVRAQWLLDSVEDLF